MSFEKYSLPQDTYTFSNEQSTKTTTTNVRGEQFRVELLPWRTNREGELYRIAYVWAVITSKTRRWKQGLYSSAVINNKEMVRNELVSRGRPWSLKLIKDNKTHNMIETIKHIINKTYGKGQTFPNMRGRFTVTKIEDESKW